jgi:hypothetical protein
MSLFAERHGFALFRLPHACPFKSHHALLVPLTSPECYSAPGPDADRRARSLIQLVQAGSRSDADSHPKLDPLALMAAVTSAKGPLEVTTLLHQNSHPEAQRGVGSSSRSGLR